MEGVRGIYRLILGTFPIIDPANRGGKVAMTASSEGLRSALRRSGSGAESVNLGESPGRSLRNHHSSPNTRNGRPKLLGHDGHPAGLSNGRQPVLPARNEAPGPASAASQ